VIALLDGDIVAYRSASSCEPNKVKADREPLEFAIARADELMRRILHNTNAESFRAFISGPENYRYKIEFLVTNWNATVSDGIEADDNLGIHQTDETVICSIDKDLLQIPGYHYNFVREEWNKITVHQGWVNFYTQIVMGDRSDNIMGYDGKMRQKVPKFLEPTIAKIVDCDTPKQMFAVVREIYELGDEALLRNGQLLYIQRTEGDTWNFPS
jgi:hypothetical protein